MHAWVSVLPGVHSPVQAGLPPVPPTPAVPPVVEPPIADPPPLPLVPPLPPLPPCPPDVPAPPPSDPEQPERREARPIPAMSAKICMLQYTGARTTPSRREPKFHFLSDERKQPIGELARV